jgi:methyl-accepting chemotaxis protein
MGPINEAAQVLEEVAGRNLSVRVRGEYHGDHARIKQALNLAIENLDQGLHQVAAGAAQVAAAAHQIGTGSQSLAQGASEQAAALEEIASSLQEISNMASANAAGAREAQEKSAEAQRSTEEGVASMGRLSEAMERIKDSSKRTAKIVQSIDEIAFQTNLLALNAAVEAARAGDSGKGFAVVAEEVRNLAMRSAEAARSTAGLIEESVRNAEEGVNLNRQVMDHLHGINQQVGLVHGGMARIADGSKQQYDGIRQVNVGIEQMNQVTQSTAANAEESASAAEELSGQSEEMSNLVGSFQLTTQADGPRVREVSNRSTAQRLPPGSRTGPTSACERAAKGLPLSVRGG